LKPVSGVPDVRTKGNGGLMDIALIPGLPKIICCISPTPSRLKTTEAHQPCERGRPEGARSLTCDILVTDADGNGGLSGDRFWRDGMF
jgi:hypothetical protein